MIIDAAAEAFFLTPLAIAIHRFVLLGEITNAYRIDTSDPWFEKFFLFALALALLALSPGSQFQVKIRRSPRSPPRSVRDRAPHNSGRRRKYW
jgi:hypothetical protein